MTKTQEIEQQLQLLRDEYPTASTERQQYIVKQAEILKSGDPIKEIQRRLQEMAKTAPKSFEAEVMDSLL